MMFHVSTAAQNNVALRGQTDQCGQRRAPRSKFCVGHVSTWLLQTELGCALTVYIKHGRHLRTLEDIYLRMLEDI